MVSKMLIAVSEMGENDPHPEQNVNPIKENFDDYNMWHRCVSK